MMSIVHVIDEKEYALIKVPVNNDNSMMNFNDAVASFDCIIQDWEVMHKPFLFSPRVKIAVLVPSKNIKEFNDKLYK